MADESNDVSAKLFATLNSSKALKKSVYRGNDEIFEVDRIPTNIAPVDYCLGGGFPRGRLVEVFGNYSSGKTYILYKALIANQQMGGSCVLFESEGAFDGDWFESMGGNATSLNVVKVNKVEDVFNGIVAIAEMAKGLKPEQRKICVGWDSIAATGTKHLQETGMDKVDMTMALRMSQGTKLITTLCEDNNVSVISTNQTRTKVGSMDSAPHTPGGDAYPFHCSQRVYLKFDGGSKTSMILEDEKKASDPIGQWLRMEVVKNKCGPQHSICTLPFYKHANYQHPRFGYATQYGIDACEALWTYYTSGRFYIVDTLESKERVVESPSNGWYALHHSIDPSQQSFRAADWPRVLGEHPELWGLLYNHKPQQQEDSECGVSSQE